MPHGLMGRSILVTGATGYLGRALIDLAQQRGHRVKAFVRAGSSHPLAGEVTQVVGDPFSVDDLVKALSAGDTLVHLIGTPRPNPSKAKQFREVDLASAETAVLLPLYWIFERLPSKRDSALRLGLVTHTQMIAALVRAIEDGPMGTRVIDVPEIRSKWAEVPDRHA